MERPLETLSQLSELLSRSPELEQALPRALALLANTVELDCGWVWLRTGQEDRYYLAAQWKLPEELGLPELMVGRSCTCLDSLARGELCHTAVTEIECSRLRTRGGPVRIHATLPLVFEQRPLGIINLAGPDWKPLGEDELRWLSVAARQIALAVERSHLARFQAAQAVVEERHRLARDVHDRLAQGFTAIALQAEAALVAPEQSSQCLQTILDLAQGGVEQARQSVAEFRRGEPLEIGVRERLEQFTYRTGVPVRFSWLEGLELTSLQEEELLGVLGEALTNVERHAGAHLVKLTFAQFDDILEVRLEDDGAGFESERVPADRYGLLGMRERVARLGGLLTLESTPGQGTVVQVQVAL